MRFDLLTLKFKQDYDLLTLADTDLPRTWCSLRRYKLTLLVDAIESFCLVKANYEI